MSATLHECLADLENRIDPDVERENLRQWRDFYEGRFNGEVFSPVRPGPNPPGVDWPAGNEININDAIENMDLMLLDQFRMVSGILSDGLGGRLTVRCNYGTGILSSLFGCELFVMPQETDTLPTTRPLDSIEQVKAVLDAGIPDIRGGLGGRVFDCGERFQEIFQRYPKLARYVQLYHPDLQGPIDNVELIWGSGMYLAFYDNVDLLKSMLNLVTDTYSEFMRTWQGLVPPSGPYSTHWGMLLKGQLMLRNDSLMNMSPESYVQFVRPMDQRLFDEFGGGGIHFCGRGDHYIEAMSQMSGLSAVHMSQPHLNDVEKILRNTVDKDIRVLSLEREAIEAASRPMRGRVHCGDARME